MGKPKSYVGVSYGESFSIIITYVWCIYQRTTPYKHVCRLERDFSDLMPPAIKTTLLAQQGPGGRRLRRPTTSIIIEEDSNMLKMSADQNNSSARMNRYSYTMLVNFLILSSWSLAAASALSNESQVLVDPILDNWEKEQGLADLLIDKIEASKTQSPTFYPTKSPTNKPTNVSIYSRLNRT